MDLGLSGKVALIGGASRGLGKACALRLAQEEAKIAICARDRAAIAAAAAEIRNASAVEVLPIAADQSKRDDVTRMVDETMARFGRIDILVTNTGGPPSGLFLEHDEATWEGAFHGILLYVVRLLRAVVPIMRDQGGGRIINNTSFTVKEPAERLVLSNVFRAGVVALAKTLARELAPYNIRINNVCPGAFATERLQELFTRQADASGKTVDEIEQEWLARIPIGRLQQPEELADLVAFLASDRADAITGATIPVDGGMLHGLF